MAALLLWFLPASIHSQQLPHWRAFSSLDGLRESWVEDVTDAAGGRVWITYGDVDTATVYDGYSFRRVPTPGTSLKIREGPGGQVWALLRAEDRRRFAGVQLLEGERWIPYRIAGLEESEMLRGHFLPWAHDRVLLLTPTQLLEFDRATGGVVVIRRAERATPFTDLAPSRDGGAWIGSSKGLVHLRPATAHAGMPVVDAPLPLAWRARRLVRIHDGGQEVLASAELERAWVLLALEGGVWREILRTTSAAEIVEGWRGPPNLRWTARITATSFRLTATSDTCCPVDIERTRSLSGRLNRVEPAPDGAFWLATSAGLVRRAPPAWRRPAGLDGDAAHVGSLLEISRGDVVAVHESGLLVRTSGRWRVVPLPPALRSDVGTTSSIGELPDGRIAFSVHVEGHAGTEERDGIAVFDPRASTISLLAHPQGRAARLVAGASRLWAITRDGPASWLETFDGQQFTTVLGGPGQWSVAPPRTIVELTGGDLLFVPDEQGVGWLRRGAHVRMGPKEGYPGTSPLSALAVGPGTFWFGDRDSVIELSGDRWRTVRSALQTVRTIQSAPDGTIWVASGSGLHRVTDQAWITLTAAEGLPDGGAYDVLQLRDGALFASTSAGLTEHFADADRDAPETRLDDADNAREVPPRGEVRVVFSGRDRWDYTIPARLLYSWRVDEGPWSPLREEPFAALSGLGAGRHRFEVRAADRQWNVDATPASFEFAVLLPWYRETGFVVTGSIAALALLSAIGLFLTRHVRLERLVEARTAELERANELLRADLAERQRMEEERARLERQLSQSQKLEAVGRLAGGIAHDFNNLLTVITGYTEMIREEALPPDVRGPLDEVARAADRATALTRQLLAFSRQQVILPEILDLNLVVVDIERMLSRLIGEDVHITHALHPQLWRVCADRGQVEQVLVNLAVNARDAMPNGGRLTIETSNAVLDDSFVHAHVGTRQGEHVLLSVSDTGVGMDAETQRRAFEPFFTTKERGSGTGLGLATVYGIVRRAGGHVWIYSEPGHGTSFKIYLPRAQGSVAPSPAATPPARAAGGRERILLVEDEDGVRRVTASLLRGFGYSVVEAESAEAALTLLDEGESPGLIVCDLVLPGMSGAQLAERLGQQRPGLRVLFMSGYADDTVVRHGLLGADAPFVQKPFSGDALARKVREVLDR